jgi:hypothetical protein
VRDGRLQRADKIGASVFRRDSMQHPDGMSSWRTPAGPVRLRAGEHLDDVGKQVLIVPLHQHPLRMQPPEHVVVREGLYQRFRAGVL